MKTGLFFGSFNPVHIGHIAVAGYIINFSDIEQIWFILTPRNPHKQENILDYDHRLKMLKLAIGNNKRIKVSDIESRLPLPSYTINTLNHLKEKYPENEFVLIIGADNLTDFHRWKDAGKIISNFHRCVYPRHSFNEKELHSHQNISYLSAPKIEISSSFIRQTIADGKDASYFLPLKVFNYIKKMDLYKG